MDFLILAFATFRISSLIADEAGPFGLFDRARCLVGVERDPQSGKSYGTNDFAVGVVCIWCNSVWVAIPLVILYMFFKQWTLLLCLPLAISTAALLISEVANFLLRGNNG
jgi:hypothetical protein